MQDDRDIKPTILEVDIYPTSPEEQEERQFNCVRNLLADYGFSIADISTEQDSNPVLTDAFTTLDSNIESVEQIVKTLEEWYPGHEVSYSRIYSDLYRETAIFPETQLIAVEYVKGGATDYQAMTEYTE
ncbi:MULTISPECIES: hypothetical protein [Haloferax]|uniref:Uncharacterized protein n=2 Tax=Haloferax TaxID=2251 RepID=A0A6G1Z7A9_9EURY|nr:MULTISPECIES: hypothetical protein [Haloferax]KAB1184809.1 hypothetical protein Hfx1149_17250 [Haloferax sp. CBA1149]MRW82440.1 hypothetical protein [Haloferax marinisediminis]